MSNILLISIEKNGKTLHLLKSGSKPTLGGKKRQKVPILGSFGEYNDSKKKAVN